jgi:hypothetical protein
MEAHVPIASQLSRRFAVIGLLCGLVTGCADALSRTDSITPYSGDSLAANKAIQIVDPWKRESFDTNIRSEGVRAAAAMRRYSGADAATSPMPAGITK